MNDLRINSTDPYSLSNLMAHKRKGEARITIEENNCDCSFAEIELDDFSVDDIKSLISWLSDYATERG